MQAAITSHSIKRTWLIIFLILIVVLNHIVLLTKISVLLTYFFTSVFFIFDTKYKKFYRLLLPWFLILFTGMIFSYNFESRDVFRDIFYFINPLFFFIIGKSIP